MSDSNVIRLANHWDKLSPEAREKHKDALVEAVLAHPQAVIAPLLELYAETNERRYLELAGTLAAGTIMEGVLDKLAKEFGVDRDELKED